MRVGFSIVDSHVHLLDPAALSYPWLKSIPSLQRCFLPQDLFADSAPLSVERIVVVQAEVDAPQHIREVQWVSSLKRREPRIGGLVAWAPLEEGPVVRRELEALAENSLVKGVRRIIASEADSTFCLGRNFIRGVRMLSRFGFSFDLCVDHLQLANAIELVRACPEVRFVLDHVGQPDIKNGVLNPWQADIKELARLPNVYCKLSGMATQADRDRWRAEDLLPFIDTVLSCFGFDRCMYGGDWPIARLATSYLRWVHTLLEAVRGCSDSELRKLFFDNATIFYRLSNNTGHDHNLRCGDEF